MENNQNLSANDIASLMIEFADLRKQQKRQLAFLSKLIEFSDVEYVPNSLFDRAKEIIKESKK